MQIEQYAFGKIVIDGSVYTDDIKIIADHVVPHWFRASGHLVTPGDLDDVLAAGPAILLLGKGEPGRMACSQALVDLMAEKQIELIETPTSEAVSIFNQLRSMDKNVAAGLHLTC